jgi:hypothetical protein
VPAKQRTPALIEKAKKETTNKFVATAQSARNEVLPPEKQKKPLVEFYRKLHPSVADKLESTIRRFTNHPVVRDGDFEYTLEEKSILAMCFAAERDSNRELDEAEMEIAREATDVPEAEDTVTSQHKADPTEFHSKDAPTVIAKATSERRVVKQATDAIQ